jgi:hypothetical protein
VPEQEYFIYICSDKLLRTALPASPTGALHWNFSTKPLSTTFSGQTILNSKITPTPAKWYGYVYAHVNECIGVDVRVMQKEANRYKSSIV